MWRDDGFHTEKLQHGENKQVCLVCLVNNCKRKDGYLHNGSQFQRNKATINHNHNTFNHSKSLKQK